MQIKTVVALSLAAVVAAQDLSSLPPCVATTAISNIGSSGCSLTDAKCVCQSQAFISKLGPLVLSACTTAETAANGGDQTKGAAAAAKDVAAAKAFAESYCKSAGVTITFPPDTSAPAPAPAPASSAPASSAPAPAPASSAPASSAPASSAAATSAAASSSAAPTYGATTVSSMPSASSNSTGVAATSSTPSQTIVPGAAANVAVKSGLVVLAGAVAAAFAL